MSDTEVLLNLIPEKMSVFNPETQSEREMRLSQLKFNKPFDERLTDASLILAKMQRHDTRAFEASLRCDFISEDMSYIERYNKMYAFCRWGLERKRVVTSDEYASSEEWLAMFNWRKQQVSSTRNTSPVDAHAE